MSIRFHRTRDPIARPTAVERATGGHYPSVNLSLTAGYLVDILDSARKHGISDADIRHAWTHALRYVLQEYDGEARLLVLGLARDGSLLELVAVEADQPSRIIHADRMRPKFYGYL